MSKSKMPINTCFLVMLMSIALASAASPRSPITNNAEWKNGRPVALPGLKRLKVESVFLYQPQTNWTYSHHPSITFFNGRFFAIWSNSRRDEDAPGQRVLMASSKDFAHWTTPRPLVDSVTGSNGVQRVLTAAGFHQHDGMLVAYFGNYGPNKETTHLQAVTTTDGEHRSPVREIGVPVNPNHGPQRTASGRLIIAGNISFPYTDDPSGLAGWRMTGIYPPEMAATIKDDPASFWEVAKQQGWSAALCEGSFYQTDDGVLHTLLRNTGRRSAHRLWLTESRDNGATWSTPVETEFSDTNAKFHFGRLPDGRFYYVGNPIGSGRTPLVLSIAQDGVVFDRHIVLGETPYPRRRAGAAEGGEYGYPHTLIHDGYLHVIVSRQKEAVEVLRIALNEIDGMAAPRDVVFTARADGSPQRYLEFLPHGYTTNKSWPLMIFLHGHGADRWQITKGGQWKEIQAVCDVAARRRMILVSPEYRAATSWMGPAAEADLVQIIQEQKMKHPISKTFLCGGSMGGTSVLIFTALHPELVDGVVSMNGTANMMEFAGFEDAIAASYGGKKSERPDEYRKRSPELMPARFGTMPVAFTAGGQDTVVPPQSVLRLSQELEKQNPGRVRMLYREKVGHTTSYEDAIAALEFVIDRRPSVGAIRWDAWSGGRVTEQVERTLGPAKYHDRLPWFANVTSEHQVRIDGSQPGIMEQEIDFAADAGLDYWAFLLYPESDTMSLALSQYLKSPRRRRLNFCVILHNAFGVPEAAWPRELARVVSLLKEPGYQTVLGNRPLVFEFQARLGSQFPRQRFAEFRRAAQEAGLNPYCVFMGWNPAADFARESANGFDAVSAYALGSDVATFAELARQVEQAYWQKAAEAKVPFVPLVTTGWDKQPRKDHPVSWEKNQAYHQQAIFPARAEPQEIASHLERALAFVGQHSDSCVANTVIVYAWNEHDEGGWLAPTWTPSSQPDHTRLNAVGAVLSRRGASLIPRPATTE